MSEHNLIAFASIIILGITAQWIAWRIKFPSILFLLIFGFIAGPVTGFINPDKLMGDLLLPIVSISVAVILFEGGLTLRISELKEVGKVVFLLISAGVLITWIISALSAHFILKLNWKISILLGAILVVTGPTVIGPLLTLIRPVKKVGALLKWEGIVIDPVGALLAVLVFEVIFVGEIMKAGSLVFWGIFNTIFFGGIIGLVMAGLLVILLRKFWIPDFLQESVALMLVFSAFVISNYIQPESGLFAATLMGLALDNQKQVSIKHIVEFKENLRVLIISSLFILLAARLKISDFNNLNTDVLLFLVILIFIARPLAVFISTIKSELNWRERAFISWMAPRGIVAAAVASVFALELNQTGLTQTEYLVPVTFIVIIATVAIYGLTSLPIARILKVAQTNPQGVLFVGAQTWAREIAKILIEKKIKVIMVDTNRDNIRQARMDGIPAYYGSVLSEHIISEIDLDGIGKLLALTPNDEANSLAALNFSEVFESGELYQLSPHNEKKGNQNDFSPKHLRGRFLFGTGISYNFITNYYLAGWRVKSTKISDEFSFDDFKTKHENSFIPLFVISDDLKLNIVTSADELIPKSGQTIISMLKDIENGLKEKRPI